MSRVLSAIVVNYRSAGKAARCIATLRDAFSAERIDGEIVLVDCGSPASDSLALAAIPADTKVLLAENRGYSGGVNAGLARAKGACLLLSNADVEYRRGCLTPLLAAAREERVGAAGPLAEWDAAGRVHLPYGFDPGFLEEIAMLRGGGSLARRDRRFARFARGALSLWDHGGAAPHLSGAVLAARREVFDRVGRFDERFPFEYEETDWERRVRRRGYELRYVNEARVRHAWGGGAASDPEVERRRRLSRRRFRESRWGAFGCAILERAAERGALPPSLPPLASDTLTARPAAWLGMSPNPAGFPFAGVDLREGFSLPSELEEAMADRTWYWTVFSASDGRPLERYARRGERE